MLFTVQTDTNTSDPMAAKIALRVAKQWQAHGSNTVTITDSDGHAWLVDSLRRLVKEGWRLRGRGQSLRKPYVKPYANRRPRRAKRLILLGKWCDGG